MQFEKIPPKKTILESGFTEQGDAPVVFSGTEVNKKAQHRFSEGVPYEFIQTPGEEIPVSDSSIIFTDVTTGDVSTSSHGFFPKLPVASGKYLKDDLTWVAIAAGGDMLKSDNLSGLSSYAIARTNILGTPTGNALKVVRVNSGGTDYELATLAAMGDMLKSDNLSGLSSYPTARANLIGTTAGNAFKVVRVNAGGTDYELAVPTAGAYDYGMAYVIAAGLLMN